MRSMHIALVAFIVIQLSGCAAGHMLMAGYTPPQTIADLLNEHKLAAGGIPPELAMNGRQHNQIDVNEYRASAAENLDVSTGHAERFGQSPYQQIEAFRPRFSYKSLHDYAAQLSMELVRTRHGMHPNARMGISSFVMLDKTLQNTSILGNQLAEYLMTEMQQQGIPVVDHKLMPALEVTSKGDVTFSRDVLRLSKQNVMDYVLSGTLVEQANGVFVNARIISIQSNRVVSSASIFIPDFVADAVSMAYIFQ